MSGTRKATHSGSWYTNNGDRLKRELDGWLGNVEPLDGLDYHPPLADSKAIIAPHAGYSYSGPTAAWAYKAIPVDKIKRVFLLGPSHHAALPGCALSPFEKYATPLGDIPLDRETIDGLSQTDLFVRMGEHTDEDEHSLEMHLPYIRHIFAQESELKLVPILIGHLPKALGERIARVLEPYFRDPETYFIISSDFCHWGKRFNCMPYYPNAPPTPNAVPPVAPHEQPASFEPPELTKYSRKTDVPETPIWRSIEYMDHEAMDLLRRPGGDGSVEMWEAYLGRTRNTICGRNPILLVLQLLEHVARRDGEEAYEFVFVRYEQSSQCVHETDSSVSYVSGVLRPKSS